MATPTPTPDPHNWWKDALERIIWSSLVAILSIVIVVLGDFSDKAVWVPALILVLTTVKTFVARFVGSNQTAAIGGNG